MTHSGVTLINPQLVFDKIKLVPGMRVADFGCGRTGHLVFPSAKVVGEHGIVYAIDIIKNILDSIKSMSRSEGLENVQVIWSDIEKEGKTPIPDNSLDAAFFVNVLFQLKNRESAMREAIRLLKKNGFLVIIDWSRKLSTLGPSAEQMIKPGELVSLAQKEGVELTSNDKMSEYSFLLVFKK